jgi:Fe-S cluster biogenesis protein NfuA
MEVAIVEATVELADEVRERVERALCRARPFLKVDGGDVELVRIDLEAGIVEVRLLGACRTCSLAPMTLRAGIERCILHDAPEIRRVEAV